MNLQEGIFRAVARMLAAGGLVAAGGCGRSAESVPAPASLEVQVGELRILKTIPHVPVEGFAGPGDSPFFVKERIPHVQQFPCSSCHDQPLAAAEANPPVERRTMHVDIELSHAGPEIMDCRTCHDPDNLDNLHTTQGTPIPMNQAQQLCTQCHFQQAQDWAGGAHGKRLAGWQGKRVVMNCTECHNPHQPAIAPQWPVTFPILPHAKTKAHGAKGHHE